MIKEITKDREVAMHIAMDVFMDSAVEPLLEKMYKEDHKLLKDTYCLLLESFNNFREQYHKRVHSAYLYAQDNDLAAESHFWIFQWSEYKAFCLDFGRVCNERGINVWTDLDEAVDYFVDNPMTSGKEDNDG